MTITINLAPEVEAQLRDAAAQEGQDAEAVAATLLAETLAWKAQERAEAIAGIQRGLDAAAAGRVRPLGEFIAEERARLNLPPV